MLKGLIVACFTSLIISIFITGAAKSYAESMNEKLAENFIRFHVIANSDSQSDQSLKLAIRDKVLEEMAPHLNRSDSIEESRKILLDARDKINGIAKEIIKQWGVNYDVTSTLQDVYMPTKRYGDLILPAGTYEAFCIRLGEAKGRNWWCVMYPPLCYVDATCGQVPKKNKEELKNMLTEEEYNLIFVDSMNNQKEQKKNQKVKVKFKLIEWWQKR